MPIPERDETTTKLLALLIGMRKELKISKAELSRRTGLAWETITRMETSAHDPYLSSLQRYARGLGVALRVEIVHGWSVGPSASGDTSPLGQDDTEESTVDNKDA